MLLVAVARIVRICLYLQDVAGTTTAAMRSVAPFNKGKSANKTCNPQALFLLKVRDIPRFSSEGAEACGVHWGADPGNRT